MRTFLLALIFTLFPATTVLACLGGQWEGHHYPSCTIPLPNPTERVTVVKVRGPTALSPFHLGNSSKRTRFVTVTVKAGDQPHYLVLSASEQTIWRFEGDTDSISRVIVLGAKFIGPKAAGVIGIPANRLHFTKPDMTALDGVTRTSCTRIYRACTEAQWFGTKIDERITFHPRAVQPRQKSFALERSLLGRTRGPDGLITVKRAKRPGGMVHFDPAAVISPNPVEPYRILPGFPGLQALVDTGALIPMGTTLHSRKVAAYGEAFSARYRSRFDPDYLFTPIVKYIVARPLTLPPQLRNTTFMVAKGVEPPKMNGNSSYNACLYFEQDANQPVLNVGYGGIKCRQTPPHIEQTNRWNFNSALEFDNLKAGNDCRMPGLPKDMHIAVVALSEGANRRYRDDPIRQIDIQVARQGPVALYLSIEGGPIHWNVSGADITAIYMRSGTKYSMHKVTLNGKPYAQTRLGIDRDDCPWFSPLWPNRRGPAIAHLDQMLETLTGHRIDQLITAFVPSRWNNEVAKPVPNFVIK